MQGSLDVARMSAALERPGIDTRTWNTLAIVDSVNATETGVYFNCTTIGGTKETAVFASSYGGPGYGIHFPVEEGALVCLFIPEGDYGAGARVVAVCEDAGDPPSQEAIDHPTDVVISVKKDSSIRIVVDGEGDAIVFPRGTGKVLLGDEAADSPVQNNVDGADWMAALAAAIQFITDSPPSPSNAPALLALGILQGFLKILPAGTPDPMGVPLPIAPHPGQAWPVGVSNVNAGKVPTL